MRLIFIALILTTGGVALGQPIVDGLYAAANNDGANWATASFQLQGEKIKFLLSAHRAGRDAEYGGYATRNGNLAVSDQGGCQIVMSFKERTVRLYHNGCAGNLTGEYKWIDAAPVFETLLPRRYW